MIDASTFASQHNAFWNAHTPTAEHFVRRINLERLQRFFPPMPAPETPLRWALVAETAFSLFVRSNISLTAIGAPEDPLLLQSAKVEAIDRLRLLVHEPEDLTDEFVEDEKREVYELTRRLRRFFSARRKNLVFRPVFPGCGFIDASEADVISGNSLFEVKTVERSFRSTDIRQLVTYCALDHASSRAQISGVGLFNPRRGLYYEAETEELCFEISGRTSQDLFDIIVEAISSGDISR